MTQSRIKALLQIVVLLILPSCSTDTRELVVTGRFIFNRVNAHYYVSIEKHNGNGCVHDSIDKWLDLVVNELSMLIPAGEALYYLSPPYLRAR